MRGGDDKIVNSGEISGNVGMGDGADLFKTAGAGFTTDEVEGGAGNDTLFGGIFDDTMNGGDDDDVLRGKDGQDNLSGGTGDDTLFGGEGNDTLLGRGNNDRLTGGVGNDDLDGGLGDDVLQGGSGNDTLFGDDGRDVMTGGADEDKFVFSAASQSAMGSSRDVIRDFTKGDDQIDIDGLSGDTFDFLGAAVFTATDKVEVRVTVNAGGNSVVRIDADGDGTTDSEILVRSVPDLEASDFIL